MFYTFTYIKNRFADENPYRAMPPAPAPLPDFAASRALLPEPSWDGHDSAIACYWKVWELAFRNLKQPAPASGFPSSFIDTAFNDCIFMWDSAFILLFARYGRRAFDFQRTLDNFYAKQHPDGFICREIGRDEGDDRFQRFDPTATGPNIMPWSEWEYFLNFGDRARLARVFPALVAYHQWLREYRTWRDGSYWASGLASGMDNQPRMDPARYDVGLSHARMVWADTCLQQLFSARIILRMAEVLGRAAEVQDFRDELAQLTRLVNERLWDDAAAFYVDELEDGSRSAVRSIGAYWALLADAAPPERLARFLAHLDDERAFKRPHRVPSLSADHPEYERDGGYWRGGVWSPTNYMLLRGLTHVAADALAHEIARNHHAMVVKVFEETGTVWENYAPELAAPGNPAKPDFVGWTGLSPVTVLLEYLFGLRPSVPDGELLWDVRLLEAHGVARYPFGADGLLDLRCEARASADERPRITASSSAPLTLVVRWAGGEERVTL